MNKMQIYVDRDFLRRDFKLVAWSKGPDTIAVVKDIMLMTYPAGEQPHSSDIPGIHLDEIGAQSLIDSLWDAGLRPTKGSGSAGSFEAQAKHLEDMRKLVFDEKIAVTKAV